MVPFFLRGVHMSQALSDDAILAAFKGTNAYREGHFILSSGKRSGVYVQCALLMADPVRAEMLCRALAARVAALIEASDSLEQPQLVVSPAMGGVIVGYELARHIGLRAIFAERPDGRFIFRRDFEIPSGTPCLMVEDVVTTGKSSRECIAAIEAAGGRAVMAACLVDRSGGRADLGIPLVALTAVDAPIYEPDSLPSELAAIEPVKPGSRRELR